ncbi:hypothetical protein ACFLQR_03075 [Verrucomicrobiota bacterium]
MLSNPYLFVGNNALNGIDPLGDMPEWLKTFFEWLKTVIGYACPPTVSEGVGALECGPGMYEIAGREQLRRELLDALSIPDFDKAREIDRKIKELDHKLKHNAKECLKKKCCEP